MFWITTENNDQIKLLELQNREKGRHTKLSKGVKWF